MYYETVSAADFGTSLRGLGLNILVCDVIAQAEFLSAVFDMKAHRVSGDFAIMTYGDQVFQLHSDGTYHSHLLLSLLPEAGARGGGAQFHLFATDPDVAASKADAHGGHILQEPTNKPHSLLEACILCANGYAWVASRALTSEERNAQ
ncbi:glyoxalase [Planktotalea sp.]|uniref:VOC family protein n=1 Tax=Planktotalea sp. TaxID=2029877 RepID=UPI0025F1EFC3|nr:glyoxalase [Planktotalea sp.]